MSLATTAPITPVDFPGLAALRGAARDRREDAAALAARQFEALVLQMMVRSMRDATPGDPLFGSSAGRFYRDLFDQQLALTLAQGQTVGLAEMLLGQLREAGALAPSPLGGPAASDPPARGIHPSRSGPFPGAPGLEADAPGPGPGAVGGAGGADGRQAFARALRRDAERAGRALGVDPDLLVAQVALETGWGRSILRHADGQSSNNLFNIKASPGWDGDTVSVSALEYEGGVAVRRTAAFRAYPSFAESFDDYVALVQGSPRYARALASAGDPRAYARELQAAGYATDPQYADKVIRIWESGLGRELRLAAGEP